MSQGDVMAVLASLIGICISAWSLTMAYGLLFPARCQVAKYEVMSHPWKCVGRGALVVMTAGLLGFFLVAAAPNPVVKGVGWVILLAILTIAALGMAGIGLNAADRLRNMAPDMNPYAAFCRGTGFLIIACILPIVGWLAFGPILYLAAIGAGVRAAMTRVIEPNSLTRVETA